MIQQQINKQTINKSATYRRNRLHIDSESTKHDGWGVASQFVFCLNKMTFCKAWGLRCGALPRRDVFVSERKNLFFFGHHFPSKCRQIKCQPSKNSLTDFIGGIIGIRGIRGTPRYATNRGGPDLCPTRDWGKDDGSEHKLHQIILIEGCKSKGRVMNSWI